MCAESKKSVSSVFKENFFFFTFLKPVTATSTQPSTVSSPKIPTFLTQLLATSTTTERSSSTTPILSSTEEDNMISSEATLQDSNDILDEEMDTPKRYTLSAAKSAGIFFIFTMITTLTCIYSVDMGNIGLEFSETLTNT